MLCLLCLVVTVPAFTQEGFKEVFLKQLGLSEVPKLHKRDLVGLVIPDHVKNKYISMLKRQRVKRRAVPSLAGILRGIPGHAGNVCSVAVGDTPSLVPLPGEAAHPHWAGRRMGRGKAMRGMRVGLALNLSCACHRVLEVNTHY